MKNPILQTKYVWRGNNRGIAVVYIALLLVALVGFVALAIDIGYMYVVKTELQNAADSGSLAGAGVLYPKGQVAVSQPPNWSDAEIKASFFVQKNKAAGSSLVFANISTGYWNLKQSPQGIQLKTTIPGKCSTSGTACTTNADCTVAGQLCLMENVPAVKVKVSKMTGENSGPVRTFFGRIFGINEISVGASAVAIVSPPSSVPAGGSFPYVLSACVINDYFSQNPLPDPPIQITNVSLYHTKKWGDISPGQWTDLTKDKYPSANLLKDYIDYMINPTNGTPSPTVQTGDPIWIDPGTKEAVYKATQDLICAGKGLVLMPVVGTPPSCTITADTDMTVQGFVAIQLLCAGKQSSCARSVECDSHTIKGQFVNYFATYPGTKPGGSPGNAVSPPVLVK